MTFIAPRFRATSLTGIEAAAAAVHRAGGIAVLTHPTREETSCSHDLCADVLETWNGTQDSWVPRPKLLRTRFAMQEGGLPIGRFGSPVAHVRHRTFPVETILHTDAASPGTALERLRTGDLSLGRRPIDIDAIGCRPEGIHWVLSVSCSASSAVFAGGYWSPLP